MSEKTSVWVYTSENHGTSIEVPVTPETTVRNILECVRDPVRGDGYLVAVAGDTEYILQEGDNAYTFLYEIWNTSGATPSFLLRYCSQQAEWPPPELEARRHQMRRPQEHVATQDELPGGAGDLTLVELQEMASRQQQVMETQQQVLVAKEQRLKYLRQQEARQTQLTSESERLRKIRERVENQEVKLKKLRALRDQAEQFRINNGNLNSELEAVKSVFSEKEKELAMAVARVDQLTRQLKDLKYGKPSNRQAASNSELEKIRKELLIRNKLNDQQTNMIAAKEKLLNERQEKVTLMDARIHKLQQRLKKRQLQEQQAGAQDNKGTKLNNQHSTGSGVTIVDPFSPYAPQDTAADLISKTDGFTKHDPRHQVSPSSTRSNVPFKPVDHPNRDYDINTNDIIEEYKLPVVLSADNAPNFHDNLPRQPLPYSQRPPPPERSKKTVLISNVTLPASNNSVPDNLINQNANISRLGPTQQPLIKPTAGAKFFPATNSGAVQQQRPHVSLMGGGDGSSPSASSGRDASYPASSTVSSSSHPIINISDEERQAGSGQSSPASCEISPNSGTGAQNKDSNEVNTSSIGPVSAMIEKLNKTVGRPEGPTQQTLTAIAGGLKRAPFTQKAHGQSQEGNAGPQISGRSISNTSLATSRQTGSNLNTQGLTVTVPPNHHQDEIDPFHYGSDSQSPIILSASPTGMTAFSSQSSLSPGSGPHLNQKPALTYRYASKNTIANTYMGRLGSAAMEKYQRNLNQLYKSVDSHGSTDATGAEETTTSFVPSPSADTSSGQSHPQFGAGISSPSYPDIASDKGSFKLHTPKQVRRRHSDSENEDLNKALQEQKERAQQEQQRSHQQQVVNDGFQDPRVVNETVPTSPSVDKSKPLPAKNKNVNIKIQQTPDNKQTESPSSPAPIAQNSSKDLSPSKVVKSGPASKIEAVLRSSKSNLKKEGHRRSNNRVSFDPLALLLDASLEGELDLVKKVALQVDDVSTPNDEGITALHNAICAGHYEIVTVLVEYGCDVNSPDSDGWTPLHCAASCNNLPMVRFLVEHGACVFATTISDHETAADKCEEDEDGYDSCSDYLYSIQEKLGIANNGEVYAVFDYQATNTDELSFRNRDKLTVLRKGDETEKEWWWAQMSGKEGYIPRNLLGLYPRVVPKVKEVSDC